MPIIHPTPQQQALLENKDYVTQLTAYEEAQERETKWFSPFRGAFLTALIGAVAGVTTAYSLWNPKNPAKWQISSRVEQKKEDSARQANALNNLYALQKKYPNQDTVFTNLDSSYKAQDTVILSQEIVKRKERIEEIKAQPDEEFNYNSAVLLSLGVFLLVTSGGVGFVIRRGLRAEEEKAGHLQKIRENFGPDLEKVYNITEAYCIGLSDPLGVPIQDLRAHRARQQKSDITPQ